MGELGDAQRPLDVERVIGPIVAKDPAVLVGIVRTSRKSLLRRLWDSRPTPASWESVPPGLSGATMLAWGEGTYWILDSSEGLAELLGLFDRVSLGSGENASLVVGIPRPEILEVLRVASAQTAFPIAVTLTRDRDYLAALGSSVAVTEAYDQWLKAHEHPVSPSDSKGEDA